MRNNFSKYLFIGAVSSLALGAAGCSSAPVKPDTAQTSAAGLTNKNFAGHLPKSTLAVMSVRPDAMTNLLEEFGNNINDLGLASEDGMVLTDLIFEGELPGADRVNPMYIAVSSLGNETLLKHARHGVPLPTVGGEDTNLSRFVHVRVVAPALDGDALISNLTERCKTRNASQTCDEILSAKTDANVVTLDLLFGQDYPASVRGAAKGNAPSEAVRAHFTESLAKNTENLADSAKHDSASWKLFTHGDAIVSGFGQIHNIYDVAALMTASAGRRSGARTVQALGNMLQLDSPEAAEMTDVGFAVWKNGSELLFDGVATLTENGAKIDKASQASTHAADSKMGTPLINIRWGYDIAAALAATNMPYWARVSEGADQAELDAATSRRLLEGGRYAGLATLQYPTSLLRINLENGALPAQLGELHGMYAKFGATGDQLPQSPLELALMLDFVLAAGADAQLLSALAKTGLIIPSSILHEERTLNKEGLQELQISINAKADEVFATTEQELAAGVSISADLKNIQAMLASLGVTGDENDPENPFTTISNFIQRYPNLFYTTRTDKGQWLARLQFGGDKVNTPAAIDGASAPAKNPTRTQCQYEVTNLSLNALQGFISGSPDEQPAHTQATIDGLNQLAKTTCKDDAEGKKAIEWSVEQWKNQLPRQ